MLYIIFIFTYLTILKDRTVISHIDLSYSKTLTTYNYLSQVRKYFFRLNSRKLQINHKTN